jgi:hypothetical protein
MSEKSKQVRDCGTVRTAIERRAESVVLSVLLQIPAWVEKVIFIKEAERLWRDGSEDISLEKVWARVAGRRNVSDRSESIAAGVMLLRRVSCAMALKAEGNGGKANRDKENMFGRLTLDIDGTYSTRRTSNSRKTQENRRR